MAAAFSRMQLAAALLEYDNDVDNPDAPQRSAHDSAIFAHLRRPDGTRPRAINRKSKDYLGVPLPISEAGASLGVPDSNYVDRRSKASFSMMHNPFGGTVDDHGDVETPDEESEELEVDLASWGLGALVPKEKGSKSGKGKERSDSLPDPHDVAASRRPALGARSMSVGNMDGLLMDSSFLAAQSTRIPDGDRRRSIGSPLDAVGMQPPNVPFHRRRASSHALDTLSSSSAVAPVYTIPFPSTSDRSASPVHPNARGRTLSTASMGSRNLLDQEDAPNPFAIRPPSRERASRFDPKAVARARVLSGASAGSRGLLDNSESGLRPSSRASRLDPVTRGRTVSNASMGSRMALDNDENSIMTRNPRERPYSRMELLRPKVLVMPSPLQPLAPEPVSTPRHGFRSAADGPPLPPGARPSRRLSAVHPSQDPSYLSAPIASNSFTPNPRQNLTLSQLTFRNTLLVGGQTDVTYADIDVVRATEEGEQIHPEPPVVEAEPPPLPPVVVAEPEPLGRPPGKLYGKSLIDDLEYRKANMRSRQRVFAGDSRPSMMARAQQQQQQGGPLVDPATFHTRPTSELNPLARRLSANVKPLLNFESEENLAANLVPPTARAANSRSVFGVDTLWEREMAKLKEIEAQEALDKQEQEEKQARAAAKGKRGKRNTKNLSTLEPVAPTVSQDAASPVAPLSAGPPVLPAIPRTLKAPPPQVNDDLSSESGESDAQGPVPRQSTDTWASDDDEGDGPRRTTGVGLRYPGGRPPAQQEDSDDDLPLAATIGQAVQRAKHQHGRRDDDSDEELPLAALLEKQKLSVPVTNFDKKINAGDDEDEDDKPLGLRASRVIPTEEDDDVPLALHPEQQRRSQYHMMAAQQQQQQQQMQMQQQMMMQAQMHNSMYMNGPASMMGSGFFPPMGSMIMPPMPMPSPPPMHDAAKVGKIESWRREISNE